MSQNEGLKTVQARIIALLKRIDDGEYPANLLNNIADLKKKIKEHTNSDNEEDAMAILGYLLTKKYIRIDNKAGIVLSDDNDVRMALKEMIKSYS